MKWYRVEVSNDQGFVVAIETRGLCGRDIGPDETETIRSAIRALSGFIGDPTPEEQANRRRQGATKANV